MAVITALCCYYLRPGQSLVVIVPFGIILYIALTFYFLYRHNLWVEIATPMAAILLSFTFTYSYRYVVEDREKRFIRGVLGRYISEDVAEEILKDPSKLALGGQRADISVLFCDINDFTTYSEKTSPEAVITVLNEYFERMERVIFENHGTLKQFVGDEIMVVCGAPQPDSNHAAHMCTIALEMEKALVQWQKEAEAKGGPVLNVKFGVHSGKVVVGNVGSIHRSEYTAIGDVVNTAHRIMDLTKTVGARILISDETLRLAGDQFKVQQRGSFPVKGREEEVRVFVLMGNTDA
jgi:adenylate cyclase